MEELHTCAASPMLYYINREYSRTYPLGLYNRRAREGLRGVEGANEVSEGADATRADSRSRIHRGMLKGITVCTSGRYSRGSRRGGKGVNTRYPGSVSE